MVELVLTNKLVSLSASHARTHAHTASDCITFPHKTSQIFNRQGGTFSPFLAVSLCLSHHTHTHTHTKSRALQTSQGKLELDGGLLGALLFRQGRTEKLKQKGATSKMHCHSSSESGLRSPAEVGSPVAVAHTGPFLFPVRLCVCVRTPGLSSKPAPISKFRGSGRLMKAAGKPSTAVHTLFDTHRTELTRTAVNRCRGVEIVLTDRFSGHRF